MITLGGLLWLLYAQFFPFPGPGRAPTTQPWYADAWGAWRFVSLDSGVQSFASIEGNSRSMRRGNTTEVDDWDPSIYTDGIQFDGSNDYTYYGSVPSGAITVCVAEYFANNTHTQASVNLKLGSANIGFIEYFDGWAQPIIRGNVWDNYRAFSGGTHTGGWHTYCFVLPGSAQNSIETAAMYRDGTALSGGSAVTTSAQETRDSITIAGTIGACRARVAALGVWDSVLDATTVAAKVAGMKADGELVGAGVTLP